jgi:hypothetical protein
MTKGELIKALQDNTMPLDSYVAISFKESEDDEARWFDIKYVKSSAEVEPLLIGIGKCIME